MLKEFNKTPVETASTTIEKPGNTLIDVLSRPLGGDQSQTITKIDGVMIGKLIATEGVTVDYPGNPKGKPLPAISTRTINEEDLGREVALAFVGGDPTQPILLGLIEPSPAVVSEDAKTLNAHIDGEKLLLTGENEVVIRCGKSSITLTKEGKILLRGKYLLSRSSGVNRIKGGSVQIN